MQQHHQRDRRGQSPTTTIIMQRHEQRHEQRQPEQSSVGRLRLLQAATFRNRHIEVAHEPLDVRQFLMQILEPGTTINLIVD